MSIIWRDVSTSHPLLLKQQGNFEHVISSPLDNAKESLLICASEHGYIFVYKMLPHLFSVVNGGNAGGVGYPYEEPHPLKHDDTVIYRSDDSRRCDRYQETSVMSWRRDTLGCSWCITRQHAGFACIGGDGQNHISQDRR